MKTKGRYVAFVDGILPWQWGFSDRRRDTWVDLNASGCEPTTLNFLGIGDTEKKKRAAVLAEIRNAYPPAISCNDAYSKLGKLRSDLQVAKTKLEQGSTSVAPRYIEAYNTVISEITAYINNNCGASTSSSTEPSLGKPQSTGIVPDGTQLPAQNPTFDNANSNLSTPVVTTGSGQSSSSPSTTDKKSFFSKIPWWGWAIGAVVIVGGVYYIVKNKKAN